MLIHVCLTTLFLAACSNHKYCVNNYISKEGCGQEIIDELFAVFVFYDKLLYSNEYHEIKLLQFTITFVFWLRLSHHESDKTLCRIMTCKF